MSFSNDVRNEISSAINDKNKEYACLYGMLLFSRTLSAGRICFQSKSSTSAAVFGTLFDKIFHRPLTVRESLSNSGKALYIYDITDRELIGQVCRMYHLSGEARCIDYDLISTTSLGVFAAGVFLACGSVNDPEKEYHLEFTVPDEQLAAELTSLLGEIGVTAKTVLRRRQIIVYIKGSESIEDTLTFIGAQQCTLELMNVKIYKDMRNKVNRIANCDNANIDKVVTAAMKQIEDIQLIAQTSGLDSLTDELREVAELRLENSGMSLQEIGDSLSQPISRSGVNHRFKKLSKIADDIRKGGTHVE